MAKLYPMTLIMGALILLVLPGIMYNNMANSGLNPAFALTCPQVDPQPNFTCQNSNASGCQLVAPQCTLQTSTISFLNKDSPFTTLISGNIFGLFSQINSNGNFNRGPYDPSGGGPYFSADCMISGMIGSFNITTNQWSGHLNGCTEINSDLSNKTKAQAFNFTNWNTVKFGSTVTHSFFQVYNNATYAFTCYNQGYWFVTGEPTVGYSYLGCDYAKGVGYSPPANPTAVAVYSFLVAVPATAVNAAGIQAIAPTGSYHVKVFVQPENWDTQFCTNAFLLVGSSELWYSSQSCINLETWFITPHTAGGFNVGFFTPFLTMMAGLFLFLLGTGLNLRASGTLFGTGTSVGVGVNEQGTRIAQVLGATLLIWGPLYSEFSAWFTSGFLPNGLDGNVLSIASGNGIIAFIITGMLFVGVIWQGLSFE